MIKRFSFFFPSDKVFDTLPPIRYQETMSTVQTWIQQSETKLSIPQVTITEYEIMEQRLSELQVCECLHVLNRAVNKQSHWCNLKIILESNNRGKSDSLPVEKNEDKTLKIEYVRHLFSL